MLFNGKPCKEGIKITVKYRQLLFLGVIVFLLASLSAYHPGEVNPNRQVEVAPQSVAHDVPSKTEPRVEKYFTQCGHTETIPVPLGIKDEWITEDSIAAMFPATEGWTVSIDENKSLVLTKRMDQLCPDCETKRHLGVMDGYIAIFRGPAGSLGTLIKVTGLKITDLPLSWQDIIIGGRATFNSESELKEALENLDEYIR